MKDRDMTTIQDINLSKTLENIKNHQIDMLYYGYINHDLTKSLVNLAKMLLEKRQANKGLVRKVITVTVEGAQNVYKHGSTLESDSLGNSVFVIAENEDYYIITISNYLDRKSALELKPKLDKIKTLKKEELQHEYAYHAATNEVSAKGGAGLGLYEIARASENRFDYNFFDINEEVCLFTNSIKIAKKITV
jgi:anti-sigma regulatory factor (Ser/Thr protein kinase)